MALELKTLTAPTRRAEAAPAMRRIPVPHGVVASGAPTTDFQTLLQAQFASSPAGAGSTATGPGPFGPSGWAASTPAGPGPFGPSGWVSATATPTAGSTAVVPAPNVTAPAATGVPAIMAGLANGGLMSNPTGNNALSGGTIPYNPNYYATLDAATRLAQQVGGTVVDMRGQISNNQAEYYIDLPNGTSINAGNLIAVCNNPVYQGNAGIMDHMIAEVLNNNAIGTPGAGKGLYTVKNGQITYDPNAQVATPSAPYRT